LFREKIPSRQLSAWLFAALTPVLIQMLSGGSWLWIGVAGIVSGLIVLYVWRSSWEPKRWQCLMILLYNIVVIGELLPNAAGSWPVGNAYPAVPLILLILAVWSARKGPSAAARVGAVLFWAVLIMYLIVFGASVKDIRLEWLRPSEQSPDAMGLLLFLLPAGTTILLRSGEKKGPRLILPILFTVFAAVITTGVLSREVSVRIENAFYEMSRSINLGGVARRFEALISAGTTVGWFALLSIFLTICGAICQHISEGWGSVGVWIGALTSAGWMLCGLHISDWILLVLGGVFWVAMPIFAQGLDSEKKSKKSENNA
jgi:hypothetical protein